MNWLFWKKKEEPKKKKIKWHVKFCNDKEEVTHSTWFYSKRALNKKLAEFNLTCRCDYRKDKMFEITYPHYKNRVFLTPSRIFSMSITKEVYYYE